MWLCAFVIPDGLHHIYMLPIATHILSHLGSQMRTAAFKRKPCFLAQPDDGFIRRNMSL